MAKLMRLRSHDEVVVRVAGVKRERRRHRRHLLHDPFGVEANSLGPGLNLGSAGRQDRERLGVKEIHPDLRQDSKRGIVDRLDLVVGEHLERPEGVGDGPPGELVDSDPSPARPASCPGRTLAPGARLSIQLAGVLRPGGSWGFCHVRPSSGSSSDRTADREQRWLYTVHRNR